MRPFATIIASLNGDVSVEHSPVLGGRVDDDARLRFCLVRSGDAARLIQDGANVIVVFNGPDAYISPEWVGEPDGLPYWNYVSAEARGACTALSQSDMITTVSEISARFEDDPSCLPGSECATERQRKHLEEMVGFELIADTFVGTRKLSQDKCRDAQARAGEQLAGSGGDRAIAAMMMNQKR